jgi:SAM-dependent methyltransferase
MRSDKIINDFGLEWEKFSNFNSDDKKLKKIFNDYFKIFPKRFLKKNKTGFDLGCGTGRWALFVAPKVKKLYCIEPSNAIRVAKKNLLGNNNCEFKKQDVFSMDIKDNSMDFGYCLGVLHHITQTEKGIAKCVKKLKKGSPILLYLYYNFENRSAWFKLLWNLSNVLRFIISKLPFGLKSFFSDILAFLIYYPISRISLIFEKFGVDTNKFPLSYYKDKKMYILRNDSLDRFGTTLEKRFSKKQIFKMMKNSGLRNVKFSDTAPFWCAIGYKK